jgi:hypothetical protein
MLLASVGKKIETTTSKVEERHTRRNFMVEIWCTTLSEVKDHEHPVT